MAYSKDEAKTEIGKLVEDFKRNKSRLQNQAEAQIENNFIRPLFKYLNWNTSNEGLAVADYEFIVNRTGRGGKRPDYTLQLDGQHLLVMDAKQVKYDMHDSRWLNQVYSYGYSTQNLAPARRIDFAVLSDFEEFVVLDCTLHVNDLRALPNFLVLNWTCDDFVKQFDRLWDLFERENMRRTARTRHSDTPRGLWALALSPRKVKANRTPPDKAFLADMDNDRNGWRVLLAKDMKKFNPTADGPLITAAVQLLIDRLIFIKALSDREIEDDYLAQFAETVEKDGLAESDSGWFAACGKIFDKLNRFYNGNIFKPRPELEAVTVANKTVSDIIRSLQPENSPYNFAVLPVEILGTIYERFLGRVVRTTEQRVKIEEKPEVRKAGGVYYTPQYIVEYIVKNTVGKLLEACKTPADAAMLKILDPACGSGSFLVGAYAALIDWHIKYFDSKSKLSVADRADAYYDSDGRVRLTARLKRQILTNNLFGVDIDQQAVEVTRFSLSLKALEDTRREELYEERTLFKETVLPDLNNNIKCGNSLIGPDYFSGKMFPDSEELRRVNPFDWQREFPDIFPKWEKNEAVNHSGNKGFKPLVGGPLVFEHDSDLWFVTFVTHNSRVSERMVTFGVQSGEPLIFSLEDQNFIKGKIFEECKKEDIVVIEMNVLPDHVHMVIAATDETDLTEKIRKIKGYSSYAFQRSREWATGTEHVWAQKFNSRLIKNDGELTTVIHYIQNNHLKHTERWGDGIATNKGLKPLVEHSSGFDAVIGNPPYIRIQTLKESNPEQVEYLKEKYRAAGSGNYDIYVVFVEKGLALLNPKGRLGFILPHKFFNSKYGAPLRGVIAEGKHLSHVVHFGDQQVFDGATTYTALMLLDKAGCDQCEFVKVSDLKVWQAELNKEDNQGGNKGLKPLVESISSIPTDHIASAEWNFITGKEAKLFDKLIKIPTKLENVSSNIFQGIVTSADPIYVLNIRKKIADGFLIYSKYLNEEIEIENTFTKPFLKAHTIEPYGILPNSDLLIFPYDAKGVIPWSVIVKKAPLTAKYLLKCRNFLANRENGKMSHDKWHAYVYPKNLLLFQKPKLVLSVISKISRFTLDNNGIYFTGGGNGPYYGIVITEEYSIKYILALLNSHLLDFFLHKISSPFRGGYWSYGKRFIEQLPIRQINFSDTKDKNRYDQIIHLVDSIMSLREHKSEASTQTEQEMIQRQIDATNREIDQLVCNLYGLTNEEIRIVEELDEINK